MTKPIILVLPMPPSANRLWATRVVTPKGKPPMAITYVTAEGVKFKADVADLVRLAGVVAPIPGRVRIDLYMYPARPQDWEKRQRKLGDQWDISVRSLDLDNSMKPTLDALKGLVFNDDVLAWDIRLKRKEPDALGPRVVVRVSALDFDHPQMELVGGAK